MTRFTQNVDFTPPKHNNNNNYYYYYYYYNFQFLFISKMTYTVSSGTLNSSIPYHTIQFLFNRSVFPEITFLRLVCLVHFS